MTVLTIKVELFCQLMEKSRKTSNAPGCAWWGMQVELFWSSKHDLCVWNRSFCSFSAVFLLFFFQHSLVSLFLSFRLGSIFVSVVDH